MPSEAEPGKRTKSGWKKFLAGAAILAALGVAVYFSPARGYLGSFFGWVQEKLLAFVEWTRGLGVWGPVVLALIYIPACVLFLPGWILTTGAGFAFGPVVGTIAVSLGSVCGVSAAFFLGRTVARGWVERSIAGNPRFRAIDEAVAREGFKIVLLTRLSPAFPFNLLNYAFGVTRVRFRDYFFASWIGMLPGTILYVYLGYTAKSLTDVSSGGMESGSTRYIRLAVGLAATVAVTIVLTRVARKALRQALPEKGSGESAGSAPAGGPPERGGHA